jgi:hypothetical protein
MVGLEYRVGMQEDQRLSLSSLCVSPRRERDACGNMLLQEASGQCAPTR